MEIPKATSTQTKSRPTPTFLKRRRPYTDIRKFNTCSNLYPTRRLPGDSTSTKINTSDSLKIFPHLCAAEKADAIRRDTMVQNTQNVSLGLLVGACDTASTNSLATTNSSSVLTPTTDKILTELFQSENCIDKLETIENDGFLGESK